MNPQLTITTQVHQHLPTAAGAAFITQCVTNARNRQWGSVSATEAATNNNGTSATGAYPTPNHLGDEVVMADVTNLGTDTEHITIRLLGEQVPA